MTSDEQMDARLAAAGNQWRATNTGAYSREAAPSETFPVTEPAGPRRPRWTLLISAAAVVALLAGGGVWFANRSPSHDRSASGPGPIGAVTHGGLTGTNWKIFEVTKESPKSVDGLDTTNSTATFRLSADGAVVGSDGCNSFSGSSAISDSTIAFEPLAISEIGCLDDNVSNVASTIDAILVGNVTWHVQRSGDGLFLDMENPGVGSLIFVATAPPSPPSTDPSKMAGTWQLSETDHDTGNGGSASGGSDNATQILVITADGGFKVQHRCYANSGTATIGKGTADFGHAHLDGSTPCPSRDPAIMQNEQTQDALIDRVLTGATTWKIENEQLRITNGEDTLVYDVFGSDGNIGTSAGPTDSPS